MKIGWGRAGDERPKDGELGVITHLPEGARVLCLGDLGECVGIANLGGTLTLRGSAGTMLGAFHVLGKTVVEKDVGDRVGLEMSGGEISIQGSVGDEAGSGMSGGILLVRGHAGNRLGAGMSGGLVVVMGSVGSDPGVGMTGGRIVISGSCPPPPTGVKMRSIKKMEISEFSEILDPIGMSLNEDALVLESGEKSVESGEVPDFSISEGFENISLFPNEDSLSESTPLDHYTSLVQDEESGGLLLKIPWMANLGREYDAYSSEDSDSAAIVCSNTRKNDLLLVDKKGITSAINDIPNCSGVIFDISDFPGLNDAELQGILISLRSRMSENSIMMLRGGVDRIERLFRLVMDLDLDGALVNCATRCGSRLASSLPKIGLTSKAMRVGETGKFVMIEVLHEPDARELIIAVAAGFTALVSPPPKEGLSKKIEELEKGVRGWMREIGVDRIERIGRRNLRANDFDTASISGLRLVGYDRPLKMWLDLR